MPYLDYNQSNGYLLPPYLEELIPADHVVRRRLPAVLLPEGAEEVVQASSTDLPQVGNGEPGGWVRKQKKETCGWSGGSQRSEKKFQIVKKVEFLDNFLTDIVRS